MVNIFFHFLILKISALDETLVRGMTTCHNLSRIGSLINVMNDNEVLTVYTE